MPDWNTQIDLCYLNLFIFLVIIIGFATNIYILNYFKYEERGEEFMLLIN